MSVGRLLRDKTVVTKVRNLSHKINSHQAYQSTNEVHALSVMMNNFKEVNRYQDERNLTSLQPHVHRVSCEEQS